MAPVCRVLVWGFSTGGHLAGLPTPDRLLGIGTPPVFRIHGAADRPTPAEVGRPFHDHLRSGW